MRDIINDDPRVSEALSFLKELGDIRGIDLAGKTAFQHNRTEEPNSLSWRCEIDVPTSTLRGKATGFGETPYNAMMQALGCLPNIIQGHKTIPKSAEVTTEA